jgi:chromosomal replication initiation ATPase DnaA
MKRHTRWHRSALLTSCYLDAMAALNDRAAAVVAADRDHNTPVPPRFADAQMQQTYHRVLQEIGVEDHEVASARRHPKALAARMAYATLCRQMEPPRSYPDIAAAMSIPGQRGRKSHSSAVTAYRRFHEQKPGARGLDLARAVVASILLTKKGQQP